MLARPLALIGPTFAASQQVCKSKDERGKTRRRVGSSDVRDEDGKSMAVSHSSKDNLRIRLKVNVRDRRRMNVARHCEECAVIRGNSLTSKPFDN